MSGMQFNGLYKISSFCNIITSNKCTDHGSNVANLVVELSVVYSEKTTTKPEQVTEGYDCAHEHITCEMFVLFDPYKMGHRLSAHGSRQGSRHSIIIDSFDVLSEWKV